MKISTEYRKGVLFIRLIGRLDNSDYLKYINKLIEEIGIQYIVLNLSNVSNISLDSIGYIIRYNNKILKQKKNLFICDNTNFRNNLFEKFIPKLKCEIDAFTLI